MHLSLAYSLLACTAVYAFSDSSPFILFSTSKLSSLPSETRLQTSAQLLSSVTDIFSSCPTEHYLLVSQPNLNAADLSDGSACNMPNLCRVVENDQIQGRFIVAEVIGQVSGGALAEGINAACLAQGKQASIKEVELADLPGLGDQGKRKEVLADNDYALGQSLENLDGDYTVLLFSDRNEVDTYVPSFTEPVHMDLKRQSGPVYVGRRAANSTENLPLFEKYQFFTPGIFMAFIAIIVMLSILTVGLKALASLEVSYGAFDKEMGPAAQKKQF